MSVPSFRFFLKSGDTSPAIQQSLTLGGQPLSLSGATVKFNWIGTAPGSVAQQRNAAITDLAYATVQYAWLNTDLPFLAIPQGQTQTTFTAEWEVTFSNGTIMRFPNNDNIVITVSLNVD